jgi:lambda family phage tail tape measure protein
MAQTSRLVLEIDSRDAEQKAADTRKALEALEDAGLKTKPAMDKLGESIGGMGKSSEKSTKSVGEQKQEITELLGQIDPLKRKMNELERQERDLAQARKDGKIDLSTYNDYQAKLATTRAELTRFNSDMNRTGITAKQTAAALRGVPAQFTDIAVSLQGGQAPLTVFLQQGGQLKDMFGGAAPAAKALGGYVAGLIGPLTVLAASTVALGAVYASAEKEVSAFNKALFAGTASSGQTTGSLAAVAKSATAITGNLSGAKEAVIALASSTHLSQTQFTNLAQAAASIGEFSGKGAGEVAKNLADLGDNATKAAEKISSQYGLLTSAQYEVIHALDEQGKKQQALDTLTDALNTNAQARLKRYRESLSEVERDWNDIGTAISNAYSRVKGALFPDTAKQIEVIEKILKTREEGGITGALSTGLSKLNSGLGLGTGDNDDSTEALQQKLTILKTGLAVNQQSALVAGQEDAQNQKRIEASSKFNALSIKELSDQAKLVKDIADARKLGVEAGKAQADIDKVVADIQAKYDDSHKAPKAKAYTEDAGTKALDDARKRYAVLQQQNSLLGVQGAGTQKLGAEAQKLVEWEQQLADIKSKKTLTADQKSLLASADLYTAQLKRNAAQEKENELKQISVQQSAKLLAFQENLNSQLSLAQNGLNEKLAGAGLGDKALQRLQEQQQIRQSYQQQMDRLTYDYNKGDKSTGATNLYNQETEALRAALEKRMTMQSDYYSAVDKQQSDWSIGASSAFQTYAEQAANVAGQTRTLFTNAFSNMEDGIVDFVRTGKLSFKDFADGVIKDLIRIQVRQAAAGFLSTAFSFLSGGSAALGQGTMTGSSQPLTQLWTGGYTGDGGKHEPKGVVHGGEFVLRKEVVQQPGMREYLERMNSSSNGYADGGYVNPSGAVTASNTVAKSSVTNKAPAITQTITVQGTADDATLARIQQAARKGALDGYNLVLRDLQKNGPARQLIARNR